MHSPSKNSVFFQNLKSPSQEAINFTDPIQILRLDSPSDVDAFFEQIESYLKKGFYLAGYFHYEFNTCFKTIEERNNENKRSCELAWLGVYREPKKSALIENRAPITFEEFLNDYTNLDLDISKESYLNNLEKIRYHLKEGDIYQLNYTTPNHFHWELSSWSLFQWLKFQQKVEYAAFIQTEDESIISLSPELFFEVDGTKIQSKPMKGTIKKGLTFDDLQRNAKLLKSDPKSKAENVMIVDLIRNDLGKISIPGSVLVDKLFEVENYSSVLQMTSTVRSTLFPNTRYLDIFNALFPCGSVTGAPKKRAMEIIQNLENSNRGVYTGAIGYFSPNNYARFSVPIRTITLNRQSGAIGTGSGVVWDSDPGEEYEECKLKINFLTTPTPPFQLIETMRIENGKIDLIDLHLERLEKSAYFFDFIYSKSEIQKILNRIISEITDHKVYKLRLLLDSFGKISSEVSKIDSVKKNTLAFAKQRTHSQDKFYFHKTTNRPLYQGYFSKIQSTHFADVIFLNEKNEITEGAISNLFVLKDDKILTPPISCGVLNGVYRQQWLRKNHQIREKILYKEDVLNADEIWITNAVRGKNLVTVENLEI